jgi:hypothetical protein
MEYLSLTAEFDNLLENINLEKMLPLFIDQKRKMVEAFAIFIYSFKEYLMNQAIDSDESIDDENIVKEFKI